MPDPGDPQRALRTLVLTDLVDSTTLVERLGDVEAASLFARVDRIARDLTRENQGREIDRTDGFLIAFERPLDGVRFTLQLHEALARLAEETEQPLAVRAGVHVGEVVLRENAAADVALGAKPLELEGLAKPFAARIMSMALGGQTLLSQTARDLAERAAVGAPDFEGVQWVSHGEWRLKGVRDDVPIHEVTRGAPRRPPATAKTRPARPRRWRWIAGLGVAAAAALGLFLAPWEARAEPAVFTVDGAAPVYEDSAHNERLEAAWSELMEGDERRARALMEPLVDLRPVPPELAVAWLMTGDGLGQGEQETAAALFAELDPEAPPSGATTCARAWQKQFALKSATPSPDRLEALHRDRDAALDRWLEAHPRDMLAVYCRQMNAEVDRAIALLDAADPSGSTPWVVVGALWHLDKDEDQEAMRVRLDHALEARPDAPTLLRLDGDLLFEAGDPEAALARYEEALRQAPGRFPARNAALVASLEAADEARLERHLEAALAPEWSVDDRRKTVGVLTPALLRHGRPRQAAELLQRATVDLDVIYVHRKHAFLPALYSTDTLELLIRGYDRSIRKDQERGLSAGANVLEIRRAWIALQLALHRGDAPDRVQRLADLAGRAVNDVPPEDLVQAWAGDASAAVRSVAQRTEEILSREGDWQLPEFQREVRCRSAFQKAALHAIAGETSAALQGYRAFLDDPDCKTTKERAFRALAAGALALDALDRGDASGAEPWIARYQALWPVAEPTLPLARALAEHGVQTGR